MSPHTSYLDAYLQLMKFVCEEEAKGQAPLYNTQFSYPSELYSDFVMVWISSALIH